PLDGDRNNMENLKKTKLSKDWHKAFDTDHDNFVKAQNYEVKKEDMDKAVKYAKKDGLSQLGQYIYFDALVKHGLDKDGDNG
ncbi:chitosanase, partial [Staphylococcus haemolyticus]